MPTEIQVTGTYRPCQTCRTELVKPFPADWTMTVRNTVEGVTLTPHRPECPEGVTS